MSSASAQSAVTATPCPPLPPFTRETALQKVRLIENDWSSRDMEKIAQSYAPDFLWHYRGAFVNGRQEIIPTLQRKWARELDYRLIKELWAHDANRFAVRFATEWHDPAGDWFRSYGNESWEFDDQGLMRLHFACVNDLPILDSDRRFHWPLGPRPQGHPGLSALSL